MPNRLRNRLQANQNIQRAFLSGQQAQSFGSGGGLSNLLDKAKTAYQKAKTDFQTKRPGKIFPKPTTGTSSVTGYGTLSIDHSRLTPSSGPASRLAIDYVK